MFCVSYTGRPERRQPPVKHIAAALLLAVSITGCARIGLPFNEAAAGREPVRRAALISATVSDRVDPTDWLTVRQTIGRIPAKTAGPVSERSSWYTSVVPAWRIVPPRHKPNASASRMMVRDVMATS